MSLATAAHEQRKPARWLGVHRRAFQLVMLPMEGDKMLNFMGRFRSAVAVPQNLTIRPARNLGWVDRADDADPFGVTDSWAGGARTLDPGHRVQKAA